MIIKRGMNRDGNIAPEVYNLLINLPDEVLHNLKYGKGHPLAIYNSSINRIMKAFSKVLDIYEKNISLNQFPKKEFLELLEEQKELLHSLHSHFDDCNQIIKVTSTYPDIKNISSKERKNLERSTYRWLEYFKNPGFKYFLDNTKDYRKLVGGIVNKIKHEQALVMGISIKIDQIQSIGYFIEVVGVNKKHISKLPDSKIHPFGTAFSFPRDLAFHFYNLYVISHYLKKSLDFSFKKLYNIEVNYKETNVNYPDFGHIAKRISDLDFNFFPDEYNKPHPLIVYTNQEDNKELKLNLDDPWYFFNNPQVVELYWYIEPDGVTEYCAMPYFDYFLRYLPIKSFKFLDFDSP